MTAVTDLEPDTVTAVPEPPAPEGRAARRRAANGAPEPTDVAPESDTSGKRARTEPDRATRRANDARTRRLRTIGMSLAILATLCLGFVLTMSLFGNLKAQRDQRTAYDDFRYDLANGTAPVAQTDENGVLVVPGT